MTSLGLGGWDSCVATLAQSSGVVAYPTSAEVWNSVERAYVAAAVRRSAGAPPGAGPDLETRMYELSAELVSQLRSLEPPSLWGLVIQMATLWDMDLLRADVRERSALAYIRALHSCDATSWSEPFAEDGPSVVAFERAKGLAERLEGFYPRFALLELCASGAAVTPDGVEPPREGPAEMIAEAKRLLTALSAQPRLHADLMVEVQSLLQPEPLK